jgi:hypothetical protein
MADFFITQEHYNIPGRGLVYVAILKDRARPSELSKLIGQNVETPDGVLCKIRGVEYATGLGYVSGSIGLQLEPPERPFG